MNSDQAKAVLDHAVQYGRREVATTAKILAAVPADRLDYKPSDRCMSAGELLWHIASADVAILNGAVDGAFDFKRERPASADTPTGVAAWYTENANAALDRCSALNGEQAAKIVDFMGVFQQPAAGFVTMAFNHSIHHRGQLSSYLRPMGAKVPAIYGMSADENPFQK
ncbi:MAG: DinB family protein [Bryobacteraceae bacterium]